MTDPTRRDLLATGAALAAAPALLPLLSALPAEAQTMTQAPSTASQAPGFYRSRVGDLIVTAINDGVARRPLDGFVRNADIADVRKALESAFMPTDQLAIPFTTLAIQSGDKLTLIDTGNGNSGAPTSGTWMANFTAAGYRPEQVTSIVISHFHGDHINGLRLREGATVFANAEIAVPELEWAFWMSDERMNAAPEAMRGAFQNVRRVFGPMAAHVKRFAHGSEVAPGIQAVAATGHSPGHTVFAIQSGAGRLMAMSDTTNHPALFVRNPDWSAIFDMDADAARATRRRLLDMVASERMPVAFYHAPFPASGHIVREGTGYDLVPVNWSPAV
jgi:glyoxylase-like metal-dependent hydrolase (beta-lactamase superfamily II)